MSVGIHVGGWRTPALDESLERGFDFHVVLSVFPATDEAKALRGRNSEDIFFHIKTGNATNLVDEVEVTAKT